MKYAFKEWPAVLLFACVMLFFSGKAFTQESIPEKLGIEGGYFSSFIPSDWGREDDELEEGDKTYQLLLIGPRAENAPVMISLFYFGEGNDDFEDYQDFVSRNTWDSWEDKPIAEAQKITINGKNALWFEREEKSFLNPESKDDVSVMIKEKFYVFLAKDRKGFLFCITLPPAACLKSIWVFMRKSSVLLNCFNGSVNCY